MLLWGVSWGGLPGGSQGNGFLVQSRDLPRPAEDIAMALGEHLLQSHRDKILKGEFIDFFSLLYREIEKKDKDLKDDRRRSLRKGMLREHSQLAIWFFDLCWGDSAGTPNQGDGAFPILGYCV